jgi:hypothetical protein
MKWQPIETAPQDGTWVLLACGSGGDGWVVAGWLDTEHGGYWHVNEHWTDAHSSPIYPTHWMPYPEPPSSPETLTPAAHPQG